MVKIDLPMLSTPSFLTQNNPIVVSTAALIDHSLRADRNIFDVLTFASEYLRIVTVTITLAFEY
uniref:Uncharacterized protein n=1 Tax=Heterorhabditis bacteriophora TaxID=37862 RepID=A0A1I7WT96_HETBA